VKSTFESKNILFVSSGYPPDIGGVSTSSHRTVMILKELGANVTVILPELPKNKTTHYTEEPDVIRMGGEKWDRESSLDIILNGVKKLHVVKPFDMIIGFFLFPPGLTAVYLSKMLGLPVAVSIRGNDITKYSLTHPAKIDWVLRNTHYIISPSKWLAKYAEYLSEGSSEIHIIPNSMPKVDARNFYPKVNDTPLIGMAGVVRHKKDWRCFLSALSKLSFKYKAKIIGYVVADEAAEFYSKCKELSLTVDVIGECDNEKMLLELSRLDVCIFPSRDEGLPNTLLEAIAVGVEVIVSDIEPHIEILSTSNSGKIYPVGDADKLTEEIEKYFTSRKEFKKSSCDMHWFSRDYELDCYRSLGNRVFLN
jgi:glycosyltransferase involved in cell wall biosynthesis